MSRHYVNRSDLALFFSVLNPPLFFCFNFFELLLFQSDMVHICLYWTFFHYMYVCLLVFFFFCNCSVFVPILVGLSFVFPFDISVKQLLQIFDIKSSGAFFPNKVKLFAYPQNITLIKVAFTRTFLKGVTCHCVTCKQKTF